MEVEPRAERAAVLVPLVLAVLAHGAAVLGGFTNWDDSLYLLSNPLTVDPLGSGAWHLLTTPSIDYAIPVTVIGYAGQRALFGLNPMYFHLVSLVLHLGVVALAYSLARAFRLKPWSAAGAAALFAAHPLTVEPVAWVVGQKDLWAALLLLAAVRVRAARESAVTLTASVLLGVLAMGAKPSAVAAPLLLVTVDWMRERSWRQPRRWLGYLLCAVAAVAMVAVAVVGHSDLETPAHVGADTVANAGWAAFLQARHVLAPGDLAAMYFAPSGWLYGLSVAVGLAVAALLAAGVAVLARAGQRVAAGSLALALIAYAPASGLVQISRGPADSYMYTPLALLVPALAVLAAGLWERGRRPLRFALVALCLVFGAVSAARTQVWAGPLPLWTDLVDEYPDEPLAHQRVANAHQWLGDLDEALEDFEAIRERWPDHAPSAVNHAFTLDALGRSAEAEAMFAEAARLGGNRYYRKFYAEYLVGHPRLQPSDDVLAEQGLAELAPRLIEEDAPPPVRERAADLLELGGRYPDLVSGLRSHSRNSSSN